MKEELINELEKLKAILEDSDIETMRKAAARGIALFAEVDDEMKDGKSVVEATSKYIRSFDEALSKCLEEGATADDEFMYGFTTHYLYTILTLVANLFMKEGFAKNRDNLAFLKSKVRECLVYIDRL